MNLSFYFAALAFRVALDSSYVLIISDVFSSEGFELDFDLTSYLLSWFLYVSSFLFTKPILARVSDYFIATALFAIIAPATSLFGLDAERSLFPVIVMVAAIYAISVIVRVKMPAVLVVPVVKHGRNMALGVSLLFVCFLVFWYVNADITPTLNFAKVYEVRGKNAELAATGMFAYTNNWTYQVFNVFLMAFALYFKRYWIFIALCIVQTFFFAASGHKSVLFFPVLLIGVWYYFRKSLSLTILPLALTGLLWVTMISFYCLGDIWMSSLFSRRLFYVPADLSFVYFDFFMTNPKVFWSNSVLSGFLAYPYDIDIAHVIGRYLGKDEMGANNGFIASGYSHAGILGVAFYAFIVGLILRFLDGVTSSSFPAWMVIALSIVPLRALLISSDLFTVLLTHGLAIAMLLIFLSREQHV